MRTPQSLLQRAVGDDQEAWGRLVYLYSPMVQHWCQRWGLQPADAEDVRQEVFQSVARTLKNFHRDRPGDTFRGWLQTITRNKLIDHIRRQERTPEALGGSGSFRVEAYEPPEDDPPEQLSALHHRGLELVRGEFEEKTWQAFWRCAVDGEQATDVAQAMGMTPAAVRKAKSRVLRRLREELGDVLD